MRKSIVLVALVLGLASCTTTKTETVYQYASRPAVVEPMTQSVNMQKVKWKVITKPELEALLKDLNAHPDPNFALFAVTPDGFKALSSNLVEINRFMQEQDQVIKYYRSYVVETANNVVPVPTKKPVK